MSVKARLSVFNAEDFKDAAGNVTGKSVSLNAVYSSDPASPNYSFSQATPSATLSMSITNPDAFDQFAVGKVFDVTFEEYVAPAPVENVAEAAS